MGRLIICSQTMYTRCQIQRTCLHSSMHDCAMQQKSLIGTPDWRGMGSSPAAPPGQNFQLKLAFTEWSWTRSASWPT
ncbi:hypothetical protein ABIF38_007737 [Bradyrhizobium japonicum]|nr:hypothetical protein [Bradyrhizobium elkanii]MCS4006268.1 hypothetical protein [Bradyrhizobium elkanii USDA 61]MCP1729948.1 hypothetical protein [Bradyrhizobium elkanii]MCP1930403.1 hypothetical protein [Bradyrhizobium elkanii]MCP1971026.1 hypothetical protein [Bradyrhizobium elkanii]